MLKSNIPVPEVSVLLACYNQASFIGEAIQGILRQEIEEPYEVIVADDASTDGTREIAALLFEARPEVSVRFLYSDKNLGPVRNYFRGIAACHSPFLALLDGDDYWTDPTKLSTQVQFLREHPECDVCATNFYFLDADTGNVSHRVPVSAMVSFHTATDLIADNIPGNLSACMYRSATLRSLAANLENRRCGDWLLNICATHFGPLGFLHKPMSVYRRKNGGIWTTLSRPQQLRMLLNLVPEYDAATGGIYQSAFAQVAASFHRELAELDAGDGVLCP